MEAPEKTAAIWEADTAAHASTRSTQTDAEKAANRDANTNAKRKTRAPVQGERLCLPRFEDDPDTLHFPSDAALHTFEHGEAWQATGLFAAQIGNYPFSEFRSDLERGILISDDAIKRCDAAVRQELHVTFDQI